MSSDSMRALDALEASETAPEDALAIFAAELGEAVAVVRRTEADALAEAAARVRDARRVFAIAAGRSGLAMRMTAMRLMHLGMEVHIVGDVTTPAIAAGDLLLAASGSGTTASIVRAAQTAVDAGAEVVAISTTSASPLAELAAITVIIPGVAKQDHSNAGSRQYAGGLFEQALVLVGDSIFHTLWKRRGEPAETLWTRHANLE